MLACWLVTLPGLWGVVMNSVVHSDSWWAIWNEWSTLRQIWYPSLQRDPRHSWCMTTLIIQVEDTHREHNQRTHDGEIYLMMVGNIYDRLIYDDASLVNHGGNIELMTMQWWVLSSCCWYEDAFPSPTHLLSFFLMGCKGYYREREYTQRSSSLLSQTPTHHRNWMTQRQLFPHQRSRTCNAEDDS